MVLSGWHQTSLEKGDSSKTLGNGESSSTPSATEADKNEDLDIVASGRKRKLGKAPSSAVDMANEANSLKKLEELDDDDDDLVMLDDGDSAMNKKKRLQ